MTGKGQVGAQPLTTPAPNGGGDEKAERSPLSTTRALIRPPGKYGFGNMAGTGAQITAASSARPGPAQRASTQTRNSSSGGSLTSRSSDPTPVGVGPEQPAHVVETQRAAIALRARQEGYLLADEDIFTDYESGRDQGDQGGEGHVSTFTHAIVAASSCQHRGLPTTLAR